MGQYYLIVNLDKKQYLTPHKFGNGSKLLEFGSSGQGTMLALATLLASGNGRGGGDVFSSKFRTAKTLYYNQIQTKDKKAKCPKEILNSPLIGSWAGDRIVVAGDYMDPNIFLTAKQKRQFSTVLKKEYQKRVNEGDSYCQNIPLNQFLKNNMILYKYAQEFFKDISKNIIAVLKDAGEDIRDGSEMRGLMEKRTVKI